MNNLKSSNEALNCSPFQKNKKSKIQWSNGRVSPDRGPLKIHKIVSEHKTTTEFF